VSSDQTVGKVIGIDHIQELVDWSVGNLEKDGLADKGIQIVCGDGRQGASD